MELHGGPGDDTLHGGSGGDTLDGEMGADAMFGHGQVDTASYADRNGHVAVSLDDLANDGADVDKDAVGEEADNVSADVEKVLGGAGNDQLVGSDLDKELEALQGGPGQDTLSGRGARDHLDGGAGNDLLSGGDAADMIRGGAGEDEVAGGAGDDAMWGRRQRPDARRRRQGHLLRPA